MSRFRAFGESAENSLIEYRKVINMAGNELKNTFFIDKDSGANLDNGLPYFASGIVLSKNFDKEPVNSGKDYCVRYISPFGEVCCEWRAVNDINIIEVDSHDFEYLERAIQELDYMVNGK